MFKIPIGIFVLLSFLFMQGGPAYDFYFNKHQTVKSQQHCDSSQSDSEKEQESSEVKSILDDFIPYQESDLLHVFYSKRLAFHHLISPTPKFAVTIWTPPKAFSRSTRSV